MSTSTDAILFFGYCWDEELTRPWADADHIEGEEWDDRYARLKGLLSPAAVYPKYRREGSEYTPEELAVKELYREYWRAKHQMAKESGCDISYHCCSDCEMPFVAVTASVVRANRGYPRNVTSLEVGEDWIPQIQAFCELMGIEPPGPLQWWLVSNWS